MFHTARLKLTAWYLLIIMLISISFSVAIYRSLTAELGRLARVEELRQERRLPQLFIGAPPNELPPALLDPDVIAETNQRLILRLLGINILILVGSSVAGYFLAGKTLKPIGEMMEEQNRFITDASHELRTPLTSLKSEIEVNLRNKNITIEDTKRLLQSNLEEVNNLQVLSDGLIKLTQYQKEHNGLPMGTVSLKSVSQEAIRKISAAAKTKNINIVSAVQPATLTGNQPALTELFVIFLDNAVKYSKKQKTIRMGSKRTDGHIRIEIADEGIGIDQKDIPHLFDRFYRADKSRTKSDVNGYGLGLSIAKQIIEQHHGSVAVESSINHGTTFTITLPVTND